MGVRRLVVANGPNIFQILLVIIVYDLKALRPSFGPSDVDAVITQPVPRGQLYQFSVTRERSTSPHRYIVEQLSPDLTRTVSNQ